MHIKALKHCSGRTTDGRVWVIGEGTTSACEDDDKDMAALFKSFVDRGDAQDVTPPEPKKGEQQQPPPPAETTTVKPAKAATTRTSREASK